MEVTNKEGMTPIHIAANQENTECLERLLRAGPSLIDSRWKDGSTALHNAAAGGFLENVDCLLKRGANAQLTNEKGMTPIHMAAYHCGNAKCLERLLEAEPGLINAQTKYLDTALNIASRRGSLKNISCLLENGARVDIVNASEMTPIHSVVAHNGNTKCLERLLNTGPHLVDAEDKDGDTALHISAGKGSQENANCLLEHGATLDSRNAKGMTPIHRASSQKNVKCLETLLKAGPHLVDAGDKD